MNPLDTHTYDYNLDPGQLPDLASVQSLTLEKKREKGLELLKAAVNMNPKAIIFLTHIINDMGTTSNIDFSNKLIADDLICLAWAYRENTDFLSILETQLIDMETGFCPQGRTHRLFQILVTFIKG